VQSEIVDNRKTVESMVVQGWPRRWIHCWRMNGGEQAAEQVRAPSKCIGARVCASITAVSWSIRLEKRSLGAIAGG
jgi:hypothetical protein